LHATKKSSVLLLASFFFGLPLAPIIDHAKMDDAQTQKKLLKKNEVEMFQILI
jgi:hypothetical protein